jgi:hypothetical protein
LLSPRLFRIVGAMALPTEPITLSVAQIEELSRHFSSFRHDVNGCLSLVVAATELIRYNPSVVQRMAATLVEQPPRIAGKVSEFVEECERTLTMRAPDSSWHAALWKRSNLVAGAPAQPVTLAPADAKSLHSELVQLGKELTQLGFMVSGVRALAALDAANGAESMPSLADQFFKVVTKYEQTATKFETTLKIEDAGTRRLASGAPSGPVTLTPEQVSLFHRRLLNLQRDMQEHLGPLLELSRLARSGPQQLQARAGDFAQQPPKISAEMTNFGTEFDKTFGIVRAT